MTIYQQQNVQHEGCTPLFYPAMTAIQHNPVIRTFAERLRNAGKTGKQIIVAAMRKLLHLIYGVVKNNAPFDPNWGLDR
jgi:transposase